MIIVFDLDGTLADQEHRLHFIEQEPKDWPNYLEACSDDRPLLEMRHVFQAMVKDNHRVSIWTGRSEVVRAKTTSWLLGHNLSGWFELRMRPEGDHRPDYELKEEWLLAATHDIRPHIVFEDRASVVKMWRENNVVCCQVAPGEF